MDFVNGRGDIRPHSSETPLPIFMKLEIYSYFSDMTWHAKCKGATSMWVVYSGQIASLTHESFRIFCFLRHGHRSHLWTHPTRNTSLYVALAKAVPFGGQKD